MSNKILEQLSIKFDKVIKANFEYPFVADVMIAQVDPETSTFIGIDGNYYMKCLTNLNIEKLSEGMKIRLKGKIIPDNNNIGCICVHVSHFYPIDDTVRYEEEIEKYMTTLVDLNESVKLKEQMSLLYKRAPPSVVYDIGVIVFSDHKFILDTFKSQFQEKCVGNIFVYKIGQANSSEQTPRIEFGKLNSKNVFTDALKFFNTKKVDIVCVLTDKLTLEQIFSMSSPDSIKNTYKYSKNGVYTVSVSQINPLKNEAHPPENNSSEINNYHCFRLTNRQFKSVYNCIEMIRRIQTSYRLKITQSIKIGVKELYCVIDDYKMRVTNLELLNIPPIIPKRNSPKTKNSIEELKDIMISKLDNEKTKLINMELVLLKSMVDMTLNQNTIEALKFYEKNKEGTPSNKYLVTKFSLEDLSMEND
jgi:hypothetical protein